MHLHRFIRLAVVILALAAAVPAASPTPVTLTNPGFEAPYNPVPAGNAKITGVVANGWHDNSGNPGYNVTVQYAQETTNPHSGTSCQKITVTAVNSQELDFEQYISQPLQAGSVYTASLWIRGDAGAEVFVRIRQNASPFAIYAEGTVLLTSSWQQVIAQGYVTADASGRLEVAIETPGTVWLDDASASFTPGSIAPTPPDGQRSTDYCFSMTASVGSSRVSKHVPAGSFKDVPTAN